MDLNGYVKQEDYCIRRPADFIQPAFRRIVGTDATSQSRVRSAIQFRARSRETRQSHHR